jgi:UDPglucose 6-dehydrogenase
MKLVFVGGGYVGLVSGIMFAEIGHEIVCIDSNKEKIDTLNKGNMPIYEPGLDVFSKKAIINNKISFISDYKDLPFTADAVFIAVGTPSKDDGDADLSHVENATLIAASNVSEDTIIVIKSTVPPGTN